MIDTIEKIKQGDLKAFEILFNEYKDKAFKTAYLITHNKDISEDIVQETFTACYLNIKKLKHPEYFKTWFYKILTRNAWKYSAKLKQEVAIDNIYDKVEEINFKNTQHNIEYFDNPTLNEEIKKLNINLQTTLILYYYNELTVKEIAKVMQCFEGTVKSRLHTARNKLKNALAENNFFMEGL
ncbi:hypothetical protein AN639_05145 [Candidatus Epulonipiscium fishelsonii]|uniref:Uncharacterized protein n=1 Tax=Candidatus Epulonipiscium fishelsonii TaxID=77094 RepID=A0ACC8XBQ9_9FIRM|nr:hypothetical protein AN396_06810 [Epulopiscium sp. SCG-B11WGA-EpuloA1]ONI40274.1 hypothetical protein AN639_05145 [Epulopiscium sp. SCG-B05WGA-EpuloA1]